ncbi:LSU ribosomal protein L25P [Pseudidiomarina indica]|uniref:Large ribosomal subunit protein bL25 n=1 Tax=Pseudidiomarina indica TaxID=1159017 RepID=A0A1G6C559_9GAMM|nr:50S ribosomal protein L25/general stress protein Ctc [Pseudidiomarina indica]SDB28039.1 LSU ribosomal protein L25P [Pseudidiomarina indica]
MSTIEFVLQAEVRKDTGKGASRRLRRADKVPAILYGAGEEAISLTLDHNKVNNMSEHEGFYSQIVTLVIDGKKHQTILKDVQRHPFKPKLAHLDFQRVVKGQKLQTLVPVHLVNEESAVGVKLEGGILMHHITDVEVECMPQDIPEAIVVDVANLKVGETVHLSDLVIPETIELLDLMKGEDFNHPVVSISAPRVEVETDEAADEAGDDAENKSDAE